MKTAKAFVWVQVGAFYMMHLPFYVALILSRFEEVPYEVVSGFLTAGFVSLLVLSPLLLVGMIIGAVSGFKHRDPSILKDCFIAKLVLIPWYILNWPVCVIFIAAFLNPFMMIAIPFAVAILVCCTYFFMVSTSVTPVAACWPLIIKEKRKPNAFLIVGTIFQFIFCLDALGAYFLMKGMKLTEPVPEAK